MWAFELITIGAPVARRGTLPATGTDLGALVLLGVLLLLVGARVNRNGKVRTATGSRVMMQSVDSGSGVAGSSGSRRSLRAKAPPTSLRRRT